MQVIVELAPEDDGRPMGTVVFGGRIEDFSGWLELMREFEAAVLEAQRITSHQS